MEREVFVDKYTAIKHPQSEGLLKDFIKRTTRPGGEDLSICIGELAELILELTRYQRDKMDAYDFLQELGHVQWAVWSLQNKFGISDEDLCRSVQASFR